MRIYKESQDVVILPDYHSLRESLALARKIISSAGNERNLTLTQAAIEASQIKDSAKRAGFKFGIEQSQKSIEAYIEQQKEKLLSSGESILALALSIAREVSLSLIEIDRSSLLHRIERALELIAARHYLSLIVNPNDKEIFENEFVQDSLYAIKIDNNIPRGTAKIITDKGSITIDPIKHFSNLHSSLTTSADR